MFDLRPVLFVIGLLLTVLGTAMLIPAMVDLAMGSADWQIFAASFAVTIFVGVALAISARTDVRTLDTRQAFVLTTSAWVVMAAFGALPMVFSELELNYTDAFFESMSGITTTGSTVIVGLDFAPPGILLWRALLQWLGGVGIIVMALSVLPMLRVGGMQLFRMEGSEASEKALPRATQIAAAIILIYLALTILCTVAYVLVGMTWFEAVAHSMTTIATGGFSTADQSIGQYQSLGVDVVATIFMILGSLPFLLYLRMVRAVGNPAPLLKDRQVQWFLAILALAIATMTFYLLSQHPELSLGDALQLTTFNVTSVMTGTGYASADYGQWGSFAVGALFLLMVVGGCAGSTTCGIKVFRFQVLYASTSALLARLLHPHGVFTPYYNGKPIPETVSESVMSFFFLFALSFCVLALGLAAMGLDFITSMSGAATAIANVGPGLGEQIGPAGTFTNLPDAAKWLMSFGMLLGRLEVFTVLVLFLPSFWRS
ncbi:MAG: TrkH family potassium uptake protein [Rhodospirillaceae bacterium]|nr:TrkH family potassium uptake protein [Rhodospirillaceae bacterium]